jgi:hypothetical protein
MSTMTMTCRRCGAEKAGGVDEVLAWNTSHDAECPALTNTPTTESIVFAHTENKYAARGMAYGPAEEATARAEVMRWLAAHDAEVREQALTEASRIVRSYDTGYDTTAATIAEALADAGGVVAEEPEGPTSIKPWHGEWPGMPPLFHTYCSDHPNFGTCAEKEQAHRDVADHLAAEHAPVKQEGAET